MTKEQRPDGGATARRWQYLVRLCQVALVGLVAFGAWSIGFASGDGDAPVLPDTEQQFSLDLKVTGAADHPVVYAVEQRARPAYRIFSFDPATGADETVFTVPEDAIVFGIALNDDDSTLAVTYSPDFNIGGSGLWTLDLESGDFTMVREAQPDVFHADPVWNTDETEVLTTRVDRRGEDEVLSVASIDLESGTETVLATQAINPAVSDDETYVLAVDADSARRSIRTLDGVTIAAGDFDLDHLMVADDGTARVAALDPTDDGVLGSLTFGSSASAHGNHERPSTWWSVDTTDESTTASDVEAVLVYDAAISDDMIVSATLEGLALDDLATGERIELIASRAIRFVTA